MDWRLPAEITEWIRSLANLLDRRNAFRLLPIFAGIVFARGRRTVSCWWRAAGISKDYEDYYYILGSIGRKVKSMASLLLLQVMRVIPLGDGRVLLAVDDSPTKRYGPCVEGAASTTIPLRPSTAGVLRPLVGRDRSDRPAPR